MNVTNIKVSYRRSRQPASYETAEPAVEFSAVMDEGEDHLDTAHRLMADAVNVVHAQIGLKRPEPQSAERPAPATRTQPKAEPAGELSVETPVRGANAEKLFEKLASPDHGLQPADWQAQRERLPKAKQAELDAVIAQAKADEPPGAVAFDEPEAKPDVEGLDRAIRGIGRSISDDPENREPPADVISDTTMLELLQKASGKHGGGKINALIRGYGVMQARQLSQEQRRALKADLEAL